MAAGSGAGPSRAQLVKAMVAAAIAAAVVLVIGVLPAEYGVDPTGLGRRLGLIDLYLAGTQPAGPAVITPPPEGPVFSRPDRYRTDARELVLSAYGTMEFKYHLDSGAAMLYAWDASEEVGFDFHTEREGNPDASETFEKGAATAKRGAYVAPYAGIHGWYWRNNSDRDVTIRLTSTGFYSAARIFEDGGTGRDVALAEGAR